MFSNTKVSEIQSPAQCAMELGHTERVLDDLVAEFPAAVEMYLRSVAQGEIEPEMNLALADFYIDAAERAQARISELQTRLGELAH